MEKKYPVAVRGAGGGGGGGHTPSEASDTLRSRQIAVIVDALCEGPIEGLVGGAKGIYLDDSPLINFDGTQNYSTVAAQWRNGVQNQTPLDGFNDVEAETLVNTEVKFGVPVTRSLSDPTFSTIRVTVSVPALTEQKDNGDLVGSSVTLEIYIQKDNAGFPTTPAYTDTITGKTVANYRRSYIIALPASVTGTWGVRVVRKTPDSSNIKIQNRLIFESFTGIIDTQLSYPNTALVGIKFDSTQFNAIPTRSFRIKGLIVRVPSNYTPAFRDAITGTWTAARYDGLWDGTFKVLWTNNPAWCFYDLVTNERYGLGQFMDASSVDKWSLYNIAQYCDDMVPTGLGSQYEPRFTCNLFLQTREDAYKVVQNFASIFRAITYWGASSIIAMQDAPRDPIALFTNANVIEGDFNYTGSSIKQRHTAALVTWNDPDDMYRQKVEYVQDDEGIRELGVIDTSVVAFGCSSRGQAHRMGKWMLTTERLATEGISFKTGMDAATLYPGAIIITSDINRAQVRMGGRVVAISPTSITLDADFTIDDGQSYAIRVTGLEDATASNTENVSPKIHYLNIPAGAGVYREIPIGRDITGVVGKNAVFIIVASDVAPETWRVLNVKEAGDGILEVGAIAHIPGLYDLVERDVQFVAPPVSNVNTIPPAPTNFTAVNSNYLVDGDTVGLKVTLSWSGKGARYRVGWRRAGGIWQTRIVEEVTMDIGNVDYALYNFYVVAISAIGRESNAATLNQDLQSVATDLPIVTGLRLEAPFTASSAKYAWDATKGATSYEVKVKVGTPSRVARIVTVGDTLRFEYTAEDMRLDGGPWRNVILEVTALGKFGARSPSPAVLAAGNPQIGALNGIQIDPGFGTIFVKYARPETDDFAGILAWVGLTADFLPSADSLVFDGSDMLIVLRAMKDGTPFVGAREYFVRVAGYDDFGRDELTISNSFSVTPLATALGPESITAEMLKDGILTTAKFAADIEPVKIVGTVPTEKLTNTVFNQADGKIYTWDAATGKYSTQSFDLGDLTGVLKDAQIESIAASKVTGQMRNDQIAQLDAAKLIGQVIGSQIADGALNAAKFASGIQPVTNYAGVPTSFVTTTIYNTNNGQLYRWNGSDYVSTNDLSQMTGVLTEANIASVNASKITGQLTDNQILQLSAAKLLGQITGAQIVDAALTATKFASNIQPVTMYDGVPSAYVTTTVFNTRTNQLLRWNGMIYKATDDLGQMQGQLVAGQIASVEASKITGQMTNDQLQSIAAGKVAGQLVSAQIASVDGNKITGLLTQAQIEAAKVTGQLVSGQIQSGAILSDKIAAGAVRTENIAAGAITAQLLAIGDFENLVNCGIGMAITGFSAGMVPDASYPVFNTTYWNPLGESSAYQLAWVGRDNYYGSLFPVKPGDEYYCSMLTIPYGGISNLYNTQLGLRFHDSAGNIIGYDLAAIRYSGTVAAVKTEGIAKVPAAAVTAIVYFLIDGPANASWSAPGVGVHLAGIQVRRRNGGQLIVDGSITANKIAANSIDASKIQAGAITAGKIAAGSITSAELSIGVNGNLIRYSTFPISSRGWAIYSNAPGIELIKYADAAFTYNNEVLTAHSPGTPSPDNYCSIYQPERVPVQAGKWYEYSAYVNTHRCGVTLYIEWYTAYGQIISNNQSAYQGQIGKLGNDLNNYSRLFLNVQAPAGATGAIVYLLMKFTGETDPYLFFLRLYMAESTQHVTTPSAWAPMGVTQIDGQIITTRTIAAEQIVAETITATEIAASAITADKIAANSITAAKIQAGAIETAKIAAGAITAITIAAGTITGDKIAASTITADKLVANSITAGQIAAGAITSEQIAAGAITTANLLVSSRGQAINDDPNLEDYQNAWVATSSTTTWATGTVTTNASGPNFVTDYTGGSDGKVRTRKAYIIDPNKTYSLTANLYQTDSNRNMYIFVDFYDVNGQQVSTGWGGAMSGYVFGGIPPSNQFSRQGGQFGKDTVRLIPPSVKTAYVGVWFQYSGFGSTSTQQAAQDIRLELANDSSLIVDGAITASKVQAGAIIAGKLAANSVLAENISANSITAAKIQAGAIETAKIAAGAITAITIAAGTITGDKIAASTITADKLVANSITAGQIAAGAITSEQIAAGTIIAKNLVVADASAADPDPSFYDPTFWFPVTGWPANIQPQAHSSYPVPRILHFASTGYIESLSRNFVVEEGAQYRLRVWMFKSSGIVGNFGVAMHVPGVIYSAMGIPRKASSVTGFAGDIDWNAVPSDAWVHYDTVLTGPALKFFQYVIYGSLPSADLYIGFQLTRMASANLIVDGSITTYKIAAGSITADRIAALTITGDKIAANQITTEKIEAGAVTAAKIAAGSITADKIVGGTITGDKIAANTITADRLAANSITANQLAAGSVTAGKIAAGAVSATEIASGAITTDKLAVISRGSAINANPECSDATAWGSLDGVTIAGLGVNGASGTSAFVSNATTNSCTVTSKIFPLSVGKTYRVSAWIRTANGNGTPNSAYLRCFRMNGAAVDIAYNTQLEGFTVNEFFTNVTGTFVAEANTTQGLLRAYLNWGSPAAGAVTWLQDFRIEEVLPGTLIKDGAITTQKIAAATITGDKIAANTITADRIVVNSLTSDQMAVNSVHANRLIAGSITGDKIAANSIQADRVQAGTFQTSASGRRTEISGVTNTLKSYASNGTVIAQIGEGTPGSGFMELNGSADTSRYTLYSYGSFLIATGQINIVSPIGGANGTAIMAAGQVYAGDLIPHNGNSYNVGLPGIPWAGIYSRTAVVIVSDAREKYDVEDISVGLGFIEQLRPVSYRVLHGTSTTVDGPIQEGPVRIGDKPLGNSSIRTVTKGVRKHYGFVAQEVKKAMGEEDVGLWTLGDTDNPDSIQALRYEELIAPLVRAVQELSSTIRTMQEEILELTEQLKGKS